MVETASLQPPLSVKTYLELERESMIRHEFVGGRRYAMTGTSKRHNLIAVNLLRMLSEAADGTPCRVYINDVKVRTPGDAIYYPDLMVACETESETDDPYVEDAPCLLVEIVSPSTANVDRREKRVAYQTIPSLQTYLIVDQDTSRVERHLRTEAGEWLEEVVIGDGEFLLPCPRSLIRLRAIYDTL